MSAIPPNTQKPQAWITLVVAGDYVYANDLLRSIGRETDPAIVISAAGFRPWINNDTVKLIVWIEPWSDMHDQTAAAFPDTPTRWWHEWSGKNAAGAL